MDIFAKLREHGPLEILCKLGRSLKLGVEKLGFDISALQLKWILWRHRGKKIVYFAPYTVWHTPLFQRPHYMAQQLARQGVLYFFGTKEDWRVVQGFAKLERGLYLTNRDDLMGQIRSSPRTLHLYSTDNENGLDYVETKLVKGWDLLYEFIDEFDERIFFKPIRESVRSRHRFLLMDPGTILVASAKRLIEQIPTINRERAIYVPNGVDQSIFHKKPKGFSNFPLQKYKENFKLIVGYYGALASWVDWQLIISVSANLPEILFVFIGPDLDDSRQNARLGTTQPRPNLVFLPSVKHTDLPSYSWSFDKAWIPFLVNDITLSTSPLKVFEYLSMGIPVLSTDLPEVRALATRGLPVQIIDTSEPERMLALFSSSTEASSESSKIVSSFSWTTLSAIILENLPDPHKDGRI